ncbi:unnamed protein product [Coregonus sp. 'balchen']|nr:unnamed protein product [Coregonus sp. 'balchen']
MEERPHTRGWTSSSKLDNSTTSDTRRLDELSSAINRFQPAGLVEMIQAIAQNMSNMAVRVEQILQNSMAAGRAVRDGSSGQCEVPRDPHYPDCPGKVDWMRARWTSDPCYAFYGVDGSDCSFLIYLSEVEWFCPPLAWRNHSSPPTVHTHTHHTTTPRRQAAFRTDLSSLLDQILVHVGFLTEESGDVFSPKVLKGGPLGEMVQWADILTALHVLGHNLKISMSLKELQGQHLFMYPLFVLMDTVVAVSLRSPGGLDVNLSHWLRRSRAGVLCLATKSRAKDSVNHKRSSNTASQS